MNPTNVVANVVWDNFPRFHYEFWTGKQWTKNHKKAKLYRYEAAMVVRDKLLWHFSRTVVLSPQSLRRIIKPSKT